VNVVYSFWSIYWSSLLSLLKNVTSRPNKDEFEPTSGPSVSDMACVGSCPTLLVEGEAHQRINPSAKCISTPWVNPFTRSEDESVSGVGATVRVRVRVLLNVRVELSHICYWGLTKSL